MQRIKKNDEVIVITGKYKGRRGKVIRVVLPDHVLVEGVNMVKKHVKPNPQRNIQGGIIEKEVPLQVSNVALFNPVTKKPSRIGVKTLDDGQKVRIFKSNNELVDI
ncbi:MAG: 50S ribosomal protein L24 [Gammaproteobacteria bacterium]